MDYRRIGKEQEISEEGMIYDKGSVYERLHKLTHKRKARGKRYGLPTVLMIIILAKISGANTPPEIAEWGSHYREELASKLQVKLKRTPERSTYRRVLAYQVYEREIERLVREYNQQGERGDIYALGGKALRGMLKREDGTSEYAMSVYDVRAGKTLSQVQVGSKENEITKAPEAIQLAKIKGKVVTADALHTQQRLSRQILAEQGDYVFLVKENQPHIYKNIQALFAPEYPRPGFGKIQMDFITTQKVNKGHGRIQKRTLTTSEMLNSYAAWPGLAQVYRLEREIQWRCGGCCYRSSCEVEFGITSLTRSQTDPSRLLDIRRAHWKIETGSHYRRDVTLKEDATRLTIGYGGKVMASINNLVLALIRQAGFLNAAQAKRYFAAHLSIAFAILVTPFSS